MYKNLLAESTFTFVLGRDLTTVIKDPCHANEAFTFEVYPGKVFAGDRVLTLYFHHVGGVLYRISTNRPREVLKDFYSEHPVIQALVDEKRQGATGEAVVYLNFRFATGTLLHQAKRLCVQDPVSFILDNYPQLTLDSVGVIEYQGSAPCQRGVSFYDVPKTIYALNGYDQSFVLLKRGEDVLVLLPTYYREEVALDFIRYDERARTAWFAGVITGRPLYQSILLDPLTFQGDGAFINWVKGSVGRPPEGTWWIRHTGLCTIDACYSVMISSPHVSTRGQVVSLDPSYDLLNNRCFVL